MRVDGLERGRAPSTGPGAWTGSVHGSCGVDGLRPRVLGRGRAPSTGFGGVDGSRPRVLGRGRAPSTGAGAWTGSVHGCWGVDGRGRAPSTGPGAWTEPVHAPAPVDGASQSTPRIRGRSPFTSSQPRIRGRRPPTTRYTLVLTGVDPRFMGCAMLLVKPLAFHPQMKKGNVQKLNP